MLSDRASRLLPPLLALLLLALVDVVLGRGEADPELRVARVPLALLRVLMIITL